MQSIRFTLLTLLQKEKSPVATFLFTSSLFTSPSPLLSFAFLTMFRSQNVVKFFSILCMDIDLSVVLKKRIIRKITIMPGINSGL